MAKNYYIVLGIKSDANHEQIKSAYRQKVQQFHPDHYGEDREPFIEIQEAYSILSDPIRRRKYDKSLHNDQYQVLVHSQKDLRRKHSSAEPLIPHEELNDLRYVTLRESFHSYRHSFNEIFDRLWGDFLNIPQSKSEKVKNLSVEIPISPRQASQGGSARIYIPTQIQCPVCHGFGDTGFFECLQCDGKGYINGDYPLTIQYAAGIPEGYVVDVSLNRYGIRDFYLTVHFRVGGR